MTTNLRLFAALSVVLGIVGVGAGIYFATAADPANPADPPANPPTVTATAAPDATPAAEPPKPAAAADDPKGTAAALNKLYGKPVKAAGIPLGELFNDIESMTDLVVRVDVAAFRRVKAFGPDGDGVGPANHFLTTIYETQVILPRRAEKLPLRDLLTDALAQAGVGQSCTYQVRGSQLVIIPAYMPPIRPGANPLEPFTEDDVPVIELQLVNEQIYGGVVSLAAERKPLTEILAELRKQTGANIVLDPRCDEQAKKAALTVSLNDVRLYDALRVIADMAELKMVYAGNVYYITTAANAKSFQPPVSRQPPAPTPPQPPEGSK